MKSEYSRSPLLVDKVLKQKLDNVKDYLKSNNFNIHQLNKIRRKVNGAFLRNKEHREEVNSVINEVIEARMAVSRKRSEEVRSQRQAQQEKWKKERAERKSKIGEADLMEMPKKPDKKSYAAENKAPLLDSLRTDPTDLVRFKDHLNLVIDKFGGVRITEIELHTYQTQTRPEQRIEISFDLSRGIPSSTQTVMEKFVKDMLEQNFTTNPKVRKHEGYVLPDRREKISPSNPFKRLKSSMKMLFMPQRETTISSKWEPTHQKEVSSFAVSTKEERKFPLLGFLSTELNRIKSKMGPEFNNAKKLTLTLDSQRWSEADIGYMTAQLSTIMSRSMDYSGNGEDLQQRRTLFLDSYRELLSDQYEAASKEDLIGLESQLKDIETNLITPMITGRGEAKTTALIGPPGTGKTFTIRELMTNNPEVLFLPMDVSEFSKKSPGGDFIFERKLEKLQKQAHSLRLPIVVIIDDAEGLFGSAVSRESGLAGGIDAQDRSRILQILEGRGESGFRALLSLNHPEILDVAAQRRLHLVAYTLPDEKQRKAILENVVNEDWIPGITDALNTQEIVEALIEETKGFNSSYLAEIKGLVQNLLLAKEREQGVEDFVINQKDIKELFVEAANIVKRQANLEELKQAEEIALGFLDSDKKGMGFDLSGN